MYDSTQPPASQSGHKAIPVGVELTLNMHYNTIKIKKKRNGLLVKDWL
jgi:hypothetical protein